MTNIDDIILIYLKFKIRKETFLAGRVIMTRKMFVYLVIFLLFKKGSADDVKCFD